MGWVDFDSDLYDWFESDGLSRLRSTTRTDRLAPEAGLRRPDFQTFIDCGFDFEKLVAKQVRYLGQTNFVRLGEDFGFTFIKADDFVFAFEKKLTRRESDAVERLKTLGSHYRMSSSLFLCGRESAQIGDWLLNALGKRGAAGQVGLTYFLEHQGEFWGDYSRFSERQFPVLCHSNYLEVRADTLRQIDVAVPSVVPFRNAVSLKEDALQTGAADALDAIRLAVLRLRHPKSFSFEAITKDLVALTKGFESLWQVSAYWYD